VIISLAIQKNGDIVALAPLGSIGSKSGAQLSGGLVLRYLAQ
jgi:hypothetical protein